MRVGLTFDLRNDYLSEGYSEEETAEFDRPSTIEAIESTLVALGYETIRIGHLRSLISRLIAGESWDIVFNIAEGMFGIGREAQIPALLEAYQIPYVFSDSVVMALTLHKSFTKNVLRDAGLPTPDFRLISHIEQISDMDLEFPVFVKPVAEGTGKGIGPESLVRNHDELRQVSDNLLQRFNQPVLVESYLSGREFTVGVLGTGEAAEAVGTLEIILRPQAEVGGYSYVNKEKCEDLVDYVLVKDEIINREACRLSLAAWRLLGCRDGGRVDLRADKAGNLHILELNPLAGLHPEHSDLPILSSLMSMSYIDLMDKIMRSAMTRAGLPVPQSAKKE